MLSLFRLRPNLGHGTSSPVGSTPASLCPLQLDRQGPIGNFLEAMEKLVGPIDAFFDGVFVMAEDSDLRANRQALLR